MVRAAAIQCVATPLIILVLLAVAIPTRDKLTGIVTIAVTAIGIGVCVIPACVIAMLHAELPATYLNQMAGFYFGGTLGGALLAALYVLSIKGKIESGTKATP